MHLIALIDEMEMSESGLMEKEKIRILIEKANTVKPKKIAIVYLEVGYTDEAKRRLQKNQKLNY